MGEYDTSVLQGSRCTDCNTVAYPATTICARCVQPTAIALELSTRGVVWAYTVQRFPPKSPPYIPPAEGFSPFAVGYVELPEGIRIQAILECDDFTELYRAPVHLVGTAPVPRFAVVPQQREAQ
ncbi:Zn-ribbon domain-containing OB-fold protein [Nocardia sp. CA-107356]|uniref:Zn-ribbon domain-containing OB-fold protein n=1 Tax=Nocardia sp. CA-107356 TaxID=3239972 RepID=UPI003D9334A1